MHGTRIHYDGPPTFPWTGSRSCPSGARPEFREENFPRDCNFVQLRSDDGDVQHSRKWRTLMCKTRLSFVGIDVRNWTQYLSTYPCSTYWWEWKRESGRIDAILRKIQLTDFTVGVVIVPGKSRVYIELFQHLLAMFLPYRTFW